MKYFKRIIAVICVIVIVISVIVFSDMPDLSVDKIINIEQTLKIYDKNDNVCATLNAGQNRIIITDVPENVKNALLASEDIRFYEHNGIDIKRIFGALWADLKSGSLKEGASTITQQLIKNTHLTNEKTVLRKVREIVLSLELERLYDKNEIMLMYLNYVYFGRGAYGIETAAEVYFGKSASELSVPDSAMLIGILKAPNKYAPHINAEKALFRRNTVLEQMLKYGFITQNECDTYKKSEIKIVDNDEVPDYGYYTDYVLEEGARLLNVSVADLVGGGYTVYTTQDSELQSYMQEVFEDGENFIDDYAEGASVAVDNSDGSIAAIIGGRTHDGMRLYNRATCNRQPGSCIKPILVYAPAFENNSITAATLLNDTRTDFDGYTPTNFHDVYYGRATVRKALSLSLNVPAVSLLKANGIEYSKSIAEKFGIEFDENDKYLALALGGMTYGTSCLKLASAYRAFATLGYFQEGWCIRKITDNEGNTVYEHFNGDKRIIKESTAYILTDIMFDVASQAKNELSAYPYDIACKTGTVGYKDGYSDAWSCAYTKDYTVCAWLGYDKTDSGHYLPDGVTGSTYPSKIALNIHNKLLSMYGYNGFTVPETVTEKTIDFYSLETFGRLCIAGENTSAQYARDEYFDIENEPTEASDYWEAPKTPNDISVQIDELRKAEISFTALQGFAEYSVYKTDGTLISKVSGAAGRKLAAYDSAYKDGDGYYVLPRHTSVYADGEFLVGTKSEEIFP